MALTLEVNNFYIGYGDALQGRVAHPGADRTYVAGYQHGQHEREVLPLQEAAADINFN